MVRKEGGIFVNGTYDDERKMTQQAHQFWALVQCHGTDKQTDRQSDKQTDKQTDRQNSPLYNSKIIVDGVVPSRP